MSEVLDWSELSPKRFEEFCAEILWALGFSNVRSLGGSGDRGRDILCERDVKYTDQFWERLTWLIQCKHTPRLDKASVANDLAAALEHRPDVWWLMTSARVTPDFHDYLVSQNHRSVHPFRINYIDGPQLSNMCARYPAIVERFLPSITESRERTAMSAMTLMSQGKYAEASALLSASKYSTWCRTQYLLACCFAQAAANDRRKATRDRAWTHLTDAINANYLTYLHAKFGWPIDRCRMQVFDDVELGVLRNNDEKKFRAIIGYSSTESGSGCFPAHVLIDTPEYAKPIANIEVGDVVTSVASKDASRSAQVSSVRTSETDIILTINGHLHVTPSQPIHTSNGWSNAGDLQVGDVLTTIGGVAPLTAIAWQAIRSKVYELKVNPDHQFYASGILVHNKI